MNVSSCIDSRFSVVVEECDEICRLGRNKRSYLSLFDNAFIYCIRILVRETNSPESIISCWSLIILQWNSSSFYPLLNARVAISYWTSSFIPPRWGALEWISLERMVHPEISWAWVLTALYDWGAMEYFTQLSLVIATNSECTREVYIWIVQ